MKRRERSNGCLLCLLRNIVIGSFVVLMSFFGMYAWVVAEDEGETKELYSIRSVPEEMHTNTKPVEDIERVEPPAYEIYQQPEEVTEVQSMPVIRIEETVEAPVEDVLPSIEEVIQPPDESSVVKEVIELENVEELQIEVPADISVYNRYELNLDDGVLKKAKGIVKDGQIDVTTVVAQYFARMSVQEKMKLINMLISKIKNIDIGYVWGIVADGITMEEAAILEKLIEENFTEKEIDELYMYYAKSELAQLP